MQRSTVRIKSHQFAPKEQCSIFCARPRDFAADRLRLPAKLVLFHCFKPKRTVENFSPNQWVLLPLIFFPFMYFFRCFSGENGSFVLQTVEFPQTWCSNHFVSYFEIQILNVSKFFSHFRGNREVLQNEIRMQIFVKLGLRPHERSDGPAKRRVVLQTENCSFCSIGLLVMTLALAAGCV